MSQIPTPSESARVAEICAGMPGRAVGDLGTGRVVRMPADCVGDNNPKWAQFDYEMRKEAGIFPHCSDLLYRFAVDEEKAACFSPSDKLAVPFTLGAICDEVRNFCAGADFLKVDDDVCYEVDICYNQLSQDAEYGVPELRVRLVAPAGSLGGFSFDGALEILAKMKTQCERLMMGGVAGVTAAFLGASPGEMDLDCRFRGQRKLRVGKGGGKTEAAQQRKESVVEMVAGHGRVDSDSVVCTCPRAAEAAFGIEVARAMCVDGLRRALTDKHEALDERMLCLLVDQMCISGTMRGLLQTEADEHTTLLRAARGNVCSNLRAAALKGKSEPVVGNLEFQILGLPIRAGTGAPEVVILDGGEAEGYDSDGGALASTAGRVAADVCSRTPTLTRVESDWDGGSDSDDSDLGAMIPATMLGKAIGDEACATEDTCIVYAPTSPWNSAVPDDLM